MDARPRGSRPRVCGGSAGDLARGCASSRRPARSPSSRARSRARPELVGLGRLLGIAPKRMLEIAAAPRRRDSGGLPPHRPRGRAAARAGHRPATEQPDPRAPGRGDRPAAARPDAARGARSRRRDRGGARRRDRGRPAPLGGPLVRPRRSSSRPTRPARGPRRVRAAPADRGGRRASRALCARRDGRGRARRRSSLPEPGGFGTELVRATGSSGVRRRARAAARRGGRGGVYDALGIPWCPPELREAAFRGEPPRLVELDDVRGDLHCHTTWSDGRATRSSRWRSPRATLGYEYLAICDHTPNVRVVPGLDADALRRQGEEIADANERARAVPRASRRRGRHPPRRQARPAGRRARRARLGAAQPPCGATRGRGAS